MDVECAHYMSTIHVRAPFDFQDHFEEGIYVCSECDHELFASFQKYEHQTPWPAFTSTLHEDSVSKYEERPNALKVGFYMK